MFARTLLIAAAAATMGACAHPAVRTTFDPGGPGQYPATVTHYDRTTAEDEAGAECDNRGGALVDDATERFVCVVD